MISRGQFRSLKRPPGWTLSFLILPILWVSFTCNSADSQKAETTWRKQRHCVRRTEKLGLYLETSTSKRNSWIGPLSLFKRRSRSCLISLALTSAWPPYLLNKETPPLPQQNEGRQPN